MDSVAQRRKAVLYLIFAAVLWSTGGVMIKAINWSPISILAGRSIFSSILFLIYLRRLPSHFTPWKITASGAYFASMSLTLTLQLPSNQTSRMVPYLLRSSVSC